MTLEEIKKRSKLRLIVMSISMLSPIIVVIVLGIVKPDFGSESVFKDFPPLPYMICALFLLWLVYKVVDYARVLTSDEYAEKKLIRRNDERNKFIRLKMSALSNKIFVYIMGVVAVFSAFVSRYMFYTCIGAIVIFLLTELIVYVIYSKIY